MATTFKTIPHGSAAWKSAIKLREAVLRTPLGLNFTPEELEAESQHIQVVAIHHDKIIGTAVLVPEHKMVKMQRVVVSPEWQNANIGSQMMTYCETLCKAKSIEQIYCHARDAAVNFYLKNGYTAIGDYFDEDGIPHLKMSKMISNA